MIVFFEVIDEARWFSHPLKSCLNFSCFGWIASKEALLGEADGFQSRKSSVFLFGCFIEDSKGWKGSGRLL
jgi:hypothetical protein